MLTAGGKKKKKKRKFRSEAPEIKSETEDLPMINLKCKKTKKKNLFEKLIKLRTNKLQVTMNELRSSEKISLNFYFIYFFLSRIGFRV